MRDKQTIIILESTDGCGKTTIKKALEKKSNWKYIVLDRFAGSGIVYDKMYNRPNRESALLKLELDLKDIADVYLVYLDCNLKVQLKRLKSKKEEKQIVKKIEKSKVLFEDYLDKTYLDFTVIDTSNNSINKCCELIQEFIDE